MLARDLLLPKKCVSCQKEIKPKYIYHLNYCSTLERSDNYQYILNGLYLCEECANTFSDNQEILKI